MLEPVNPTAWSKTLTQDRQLTYVVEEGSFGGNERTGESRRGDLPA